MHLLIALMLAGSGQDLEVPATTRTAWLERLPDPSLVPLQLDVKFTAKTVGVENSLDFGFAEDPAVRLAEATKALASSPRALEPRAAALDACMQLEDLEGIRQHAEPLLAALQAHRAEDARDHALRGFALSRLSGCSKTQFGRLSARAIDEYRAAWELNRSVECAFKAFDVHVQRAMAFGARSLSDGILELQGAEQWINFMGTSAPPTRVAFGRFFLQFIRMNLDLQHSGQLGEEAMLAAFDTVAVHARTLREQSSRETHPGVAYVAELMQLAPLTWRRAMEAHSGATLPPLDEATASQLHALIQWTIDDDTLHANLRHDGRRLLWGALAFSANDFDVDATRAAMIDAGLSPQFADRFGLIGFTKTGRTEQAQACAARLRASAAEPLDIKTLAWAHLQEDEREAALDLLSRITPPDVDTLLAQAVLLLELDRPRDAEALLAPLVATPDLQGREADYAHLHGITLALLGRAEEAVTLLRSAAEGDDLALTTLDELERLMRDR